MSKRKPEHQVLWDDRLARMKAAKVDCKLTDRPYHTYLGYHFKLDSTQLSSISSLMGSNTFSYCGQVGSLSFEYPVSDVQMETIKEIINNN